jgi:hypothetical protein
LGVRTIDARGVVPNEFWGWVGDSPDRSHFTEPGHQRLADFVYGQLEAHNTWQALAAP